MASGRALTHSACTRTDGDLVAEGDLPGADEHAILEQRLTSEGVELLRSEVISRLFDRDLIFMVGRPTPTLPFWGRWE
jgi:hypothetical protein